MTNFKTQTSHDVYRLQFETDSREKFLAMQDCARDCIDNRISNGWISVKDRLPENTEEVEDYLVVVQDWAHDKSSYQIAIDFAYYPGNYIDGIWDTRNDWDEGNEVHVTHWMPLLEPPKMDAQEGAEG